MAYKTNSQQNTMLRYHMVSDRAYWVEVPSRLGYGIRKEIRSAASKIHVEPDESGNDVARVVFDSAIAEFELLVASLCDPRARHNFDDENEQPISITKAWIESEMNEVDATYVGQMLLAEMQEDLGIELESSESAEGEGKSAPEETKKSSVKRSSEATAKDTKST